MGRRACREPQCLYSTAIPLLPLWALGPVQSLSVCTVQLYLYCPYGPYGQYRASVSVQYSYTSTPSMCLTACTEPQCLYSTAIPLLPYGPYSLYRASVSVQYNYTSTPSMCRTACTEPQCLYSTAIPLLSLWAVRPLESLSACTVQLYLYSLYVPYGLYRASVPVQYSYTSTPLWAVQPVQSLSVCTVQLYLYSLYVPYGLYRASVPVQYSYTSTPPMVRTTFREPQCL